jgi:hypothetical protein
MWFRGLGVISAAVFATIGSARAQQTAVSTSAPAAYDWLSPAPLAFQKWRDFNWSESPVLLNASVKGGYNSNILNIPANFSNVYSKISGDYQLVTTVGSSTKFNIYQQQFYADANYAVTNYREFHSLDQHNYIIDGGVNWSLGSTCNGNLSAISSSQQASQADSFGPGVNTIHSSSVNETGTCRIYQNLSAQVNSGYNVHNNTQLIAQAIDNTTAFVLGGLQYQWPNTDSVQAQVKYSDTTFTNNTALNALTMNTTPTDLQGNVRLTNYQLIYSRTFSDKFNASVLGGLSTASIPGTTRQSNASTPIYTFTANWRPDPVWMVALSVSRTVTPPVSAISYTQVGNQQMLTVSYNFTPKILLTAAFNRSQLLGGPNIAAQPYLLSLGSYGANVLVSASFTGSYQITPFTTASVSITTSQRYAQSGNIPANLFMFGLDYRPH